MSMFNDTVYQAFLSNPEKFGFTYEIWKEWYSKQLGKEFKEAFPNLSKQYFAKYIPVEGEIKEGDMTYHPIKGLYKAVKDGAYTNQKKVKLFLCSRDIQVGDDIQYPNGVKIQKNTIDKKDIDIMKSLPNGPFKVIGEISPEATWVKEGDEFNVTQIGILYNFVGEDSDDEFFTIENFWEEAKKRYKGKVPEYINPPIAIKGSCEHFH